MKVLPKYFRFETMLFLFAMLGMVVVPAFAQTDIANIVVTSVNASEAFPEVKVQAQVFDSSGVFIPNLTADQFILREDGEQLPIENVTSQSLPVNMRAVFVIDELLINSHLATVREAIQSYAQNQMQVGDSVEILTAGEQGATLTIIPFTDNPTAIVDGMLTANYNPTEASSTNLLKAVKQGLSDLSASRENQLGVDRIIVFSVSIFDQIDLDATIEQATQLNIPIQTVLLGDNDARGALDRLTRKSGGVLGVIQSDAVDNLYDAIKADRLQNQYLIVYNSQAEQVGSHEVIVEVNGIASEGITFTVNTLEPSQITQTGESGAVACPGLVSDNFPSLCSKLKLILSLCGLALVGTLFILVLVVLLLFRRKSRKQVKGRSTVARPAKLETKIVSPDLAKATLVVLEGHSGTKQTEFRINATTTIGRTSDYAQLVLQADRVEPISRLHCTLLEQDGVFDIRDEGSTNGTFLNGVRLKKGQRHPLKDGDIIELARVQEGGIKLKFQSQFNPGQAATVFVGKKANDEKEGYTPTKIIK